VREESNDYVRKTYGKSTGPRKMEYKVVRILSEDSGMIVTLEVNGKQYIDEVEEKARECLQVTQKTKKGRKWEHNKNREMEVHRSLRDMVLCSTHHSNGGRKGGEQACELEGRTIS
jgi:hypothetical protein